MGNGAQITMDIEFVRKLCSDLGIIKKFRQNNEFFGNIELEIETTNKTILSIISDRDIYSCFVVKKVLLHNRMIPVDRIIKSNTTTPLISLEDSINYLKEHIELIERN